MTPHPITFEHVSKHYRLGSSDSLRDAIPAFFKRLSGRNGKQPTDDSNDFWALRDVTFHVRRGETLGLVGHNGAGKSTILKLLSKITTPTQGRLNVRGRMAALIELGGGFHQDLTGAENIYLQGTMLGLSRAQIARAFDSIVEFSDLQSFLQTPVKRYSSGMVVRLGFAIAAHIHPEVLLLDEVLAVGDLAFQQKCYKRISELKQAGTTMIFISHSLDAVQRLCDRVLLLRGGQVVDEGEPATMLQRYREDVLTNKLRTASTGPVHDGEALAITRVELRDAADLPIQTLATGQALRIEIGLRAKRPIAQAIVRVLIERLDGLLCHAASTQPLPLLAVPQRDAGLTLEYPEMNLLPNLYQVGVEIYETESPFPIAAARPCGFFQVTSDTPEQGTVRLPHRWIVSGAGSDVRSAECS